MILFVGSLLLFFDMFHLIPLDLHKYATIACAACWKIECVYKDPGHWYLWSFQYRMVCTRW